MAIERRDDGTLDTVLVCTRCGEGFRFNYASTSDDADVRSGDATDSEDAYEEFVAECIAEVEEEHGQCDSPDDDAEPTSPDESDITTEGHREFYMDGRKVLEYDAESKAAYWYVPQRGVKFLGRFETVEQAIRACCDRMQYWPNVWFISDHGNAHLISL